MKKTIAIGIIALQHEGGLLKRFVGEVGVLPGTTVMVPQDCWCVLVAGDRATAIFDVGPHELQLKQFNRQPSGFLFTVGKNPVTMTWYPAGSPFQRAMAVRVRDPLQFVSEMVVRRFADTPEAIADLLRPHLDAMVPPGQILAAPEVAGNAIAESLQHVGLSLLEVEERPAVAPEVPLRVPEGVTSPPAAAPPASAPAGQVAPPPIPEPPGQGLASPPPPSPPPPSSSPPPPPPSPPPPSSPTTPQPGPPVVTPQPDGPGQSPPAAEPSASPVPGGPGESSPHGSLPTAAPPGASWPEAAGSPSAGGSPEAPFQGLSLQFLQVWSSSTMELFGKGELTLRIRVIGRAEVGYSPAGPFTYDQSREFLSPDNWLGQKNWQPLPTPSLTFPSLREDHFYRVFLLAEERDKSSVDPLGTLEWEIGLPRVGDLEIGPTQGGKRGQYVKVMARLV